MNNGELAVMALLEQRTCKEKQWQEKLKKLQAVEAWYQTYPLIPPYRPRLVDPAPFWHTVYRQKHAFDVAATHPEEMHVFAFEAENAAAGTAAKGQRKYLVTTYLQLWHTVQHLASRARHTSFYEVIPEGAACKLYFDLEFSRQLNPESPGAQMVQTFIQFVCEELAETHKVTCGNRHVINLDATTEDKFSRHLIFNLPQAVFKDNVQAGYFVHGLCQKITKMCQTTGLESKENDGEPGAKRQKHDEDEGSGGEPDLREPDRWGLLRTLFVRNRDGHSILFVDQGVYTRNRNFRLYKCSKLGKTNPLVIADDNAYKPRLPRKMSPGQPATQAAIEQQLFLDSIITNVSYCPGTQILTMETEKDPNQRKISQPDRTDNTDSQDCRRESSLEGVEHSPYPEVDAFVQSLVSVGATQGAIRRWAYFTQGQLLVYDIVKNRWCGNVQRQHKSNNIMMLVDLRHGVYYQKCHDPDCKAAGYKSPDVPLPAHLLPTFGDDIDDDELLAAVTAAEDREATLFLDDEGTLGSHDEDVVSDDELLAASLRAEGVVMGSRNEEPDPGNTSTSSLGGLPSLPESGRGGFGDMTESDEELLAAVVDC